MSRTLNLIGDAPTRVLLVGADRRFQRLVAALLQGRGYDVMQAEPGSLATAIERVDVDVVVIDAEDDHVVVSEAPDLLGARTRVLAKWGSFAGLSEAIDEVRASAGVEVTKARRP